VHETSDGQVPELALVLHFHQPVGNFDHVFEKVTGQCYAPLLEMLSEFPDLRTHLHLNGILLEWFDAHRPDLLEILRELVRRGSVEMLTGGHREPILTVLPEADAIGQIRALTEDIQARFGARPRGAWLTERVFEPRLPTPLFRAGVRWVTLDDVIFHWAGIDSDALAGHYMTDDAGHPLALFPAAKSLRYTIPFRPQEETFALLRELPVEGEDPPLMVYADDAEKFGEWPGTHEWVYEKGWLREFLTRLSEGGEARTVHLSERLERCRPLGRVYPPTASYPELTVWAMPTPARSRMENLLHRLEEDDPQGLLPDLRGGHWRGFLGKYPEVHRLHKRMLRASRRLEEMRHDGASESALEPAVRDLYRGQCNDAYWHGAFGGVYLPHLRRAVERHLIRAERHLDGLDPGRGGRVRTVDFHADGGEVVELTTASARVMIDPQGGALLSWDLREACENWVTVMQRHEEPFHADLREGRVVRVDESGLPLDAGENGVATIHGAVRVKPGVAVEDLEVDRHSRLAGQFWSSAPGTVVVDPRRVEHDATALSGQWQFDPDPGEVGCALRTSQAGLAVEVGARLDAEDPALEFVVAVEPEAGPRELFWEWNLIVGWTGDDLEAALPEFEPCPIGEHRFAAAALEFRGGGNRQLRVEAPAGTRLNWAPVHTVSSSEAGLEKVGQGTCFLFAWTVEEPTVIRVRLSPSAPPVSDEAVAP
jgi:hypothetical protein